MKTATVISIIICALILVPIPAASQQPAGIEPGQSVRLTLSQAPNSRVEGRVGFISADSISLRGVNKNAPFAFANVALVEVRRRTAGSFVRSVAYGLLGGVVGGAAIGAARGNVNTGDGIITTGGNALIGTVVGGGIGLLGGAVYGVCCSSTWKAVPLFQRGLGAPDSQ